MLSKEDGKVKKIDNNDLVVAIVHTIAFFDMFDYPLTQLEIWQGVQVKCKFEELVEVLKGVGAVENKNGWYFLQGREEVIKKRHEHYVVAQEKWQIARRAVSVLRFVSGVKLVAVCNNFSYKKTSDIDVFIVTQKNRIWLTRFLVTIGMHFLRFRRHGKKVANRVCLSFYVSEKNMNLKSLMLDGGDKLCDDPYFVYWLADLLPIYDDGVVNDFWVANSWLKKVLPNVIKPMVSQRIRVEQNILSQVIKKINLFFCSVIVGNFLEKIARYLQVRKMQTNLWSVSKENDTRVVISDEVLKFHEEDRREFYRDAWFKKL